MPIFLNEMSWRLNSIIIFFQHSRYIKDSSASTRVELDLLLEKVDREKNSLVDGHKAEIELKNEAIAKLSEELAQKDTVLELTKEELASKTEELQVNPWD